MDVPHEACSLHYYCSTPNTLNTIFVMSSVWASAHSIFSLDASCNYTLLVNVHHSSLAGYWRPNCLFIYCFVVVLLWWLLMHRSPSTALLIKDETRNVFYELEDPRDVQDRCVIKIYCKEPIYGTYPGHHNPHLANGDLRVSFCVCVCVCIVSSSHW